MLVTEGTLMSKAGVNVQLQMVFDEGQSGKHVRERESFWTYDPVGKVFSALTVDRIGKESSSKVVYELKTKKGDTLLLPESTNLLIERHGMETVSGIRAMCTFRNWQSCRVARATMDGDGDKAAPKRYWDTIESIKQVDRPKTEKEEMPIFSIKGAAGVSRLLVLNGFLVGG